MSRPALAPVKAAPVPRPAAKPALTPARAHVLQRKCGCGTSAEGKCNKCDEEGKILQRSPAGHQSAPASAPPIVHDVLNSPGRPLDAATRAFMEPRFGRDFSGVRVHDDPRAAESARAVDARAYTVGHHIAFDRGEYQPHTPAGRSLLAHELAHTVQQADSPPAMQSKLAVGAADSAAEREADAAAARVVSGASAAIQPRVGAGGLHRQPKAPGKAGAGMSLPCGDILTAPEGPRVSGNRAHDVITADFDAQAGDRSLKGLAIPGASSKPYRVGVCDDDSSEVPADVIGGRGLAGTGKPDLAYYHNKKVEIAEIKIGVTDCLLLAEQQVDNYVEKGKSDDNKEWRSAQSKKQKRQITGFERMPISRFTPKTPIDVDGQKVAVAWCSPGVIVYKPIDPNSPAWQTIAAASDTEPYTLVAGPAQALIQVPKQVGKMKAHQVDLANSDIPMNADAAEHLIPGLILLTLNRKPVGDTVEACIANANCKTKKGAGGLPVKIEAGKGKVILKVEKGTGKLSLQKPSPIPFDYPFLSAGTITKLNYDPAKGLSGAGKLKPSLSILRGLDFGIEFDTATPRFAITAGLSDANLKKLRPLPGVKLTKAQLALDLFPEFEPKGELGFEIGAGKRKVLDGAIEIKKGPGGGLAATGDFTAYVPGVEPGDAKGKVAYEDGKWSAVVSIKSTQLKIPGVTGGEVTAGFNEDGPFGEGTVDLEVPGGHKATVGLKYAGQRWAFRGKGVFKIPKLDPTTVYISYDGENFYGEGDTGFTFQGLRGKFKVKYAAKPGAARARIWGEGSLDFTKGKAKGNLTVKMSEKGKFSGSGSVSFTLKEGIIATGAITIDEEEKVTISGALVFPPYTVFKKFPDPPPRLDILPQKDFDFPIPGASIGPIGLKARISAGIYASYSIGPGLITNGYIKTKFNPLEENPDLDIEAGGSFQVSAEASLTGYLCGSLVVDALLAEVGGGIGVSATGLLKGFVVSNLKARYYQGRFEASADLDMGIKLLVIFDFFAFAWASAGVWKFKVTTGKTWDLGTFTYDPGLQLRMTLLKPLSYSSERGFDVPSLDDIKWVTPTFDPEKALTSGFSRGAGPESEGKPRGRPCAKE